MKKIITVCLIFAAVLSVFSNTACASSNNYSWYVKRNGNSRPQIQPEQNIIYNYDGYYIDKKLSDDDSKKVLYLTFDVGYENGNTEKILDILCEEKIPAAFFVLDNIILKNLDLVTRMLDEGHLVCNHTKNHKNICNMSDDEIRENIIDLENLFEEKTGQKMAKFFRFPEGKYSENALKCIQSLGYKTVFWSFAYDDWDNNRQPNKEKALRKIINNTHNGAVMLFHPTSKTNAEIFKQLISEWREAGYSFSTLNELVL